MAATSVACCYERVVLDGKGIVRLASRGMIVTRSCFFSDYDCVDAVVTCVLG